MTGAVLERELSVVEMRPRFEGSNICTWIGFKHVMYLVEEAVLDHFRQSGLVPRALFEDHGLCLEIVDSDARILHALHMDDLVRSEVRPAESKRRGELAFKVTSFVERDGAELKAVSATVVVVLRRDRRGPAPAAAPPELEPYVVGTLDRTSGGGGGDGLLDGRGVTGPGDDVARALVKDANAIVWRWRAPYFYCHFTERMQHSGYLRLMEEVVDLFLAERGISIRTMLDTRDWIPVVPHARVEVLREALMEEQIYTVFRVDHVFKDVTYTATMDCYAVRDGGLVHTATGTITHGYAVILNRRDWKLVSFDEPTIAALKGTA